MKRNRLLLILLSLSVLVRPLMAVSSDATQLDLNFRVYLWKLPHNLTTEHPQEDVSLNLKDYTAPDIAYLKGDPPHAFPIKVAEGRLSPSYHYQGPNPLRLVANASEKNTFIPLGSATLPTATKEALLVLLPSPSSGSTPLQILSIPTSPQDLAPGHALVINLTQTDLAVEINNELVMLPQGQSHKADIQDIKNRMLPLKVAYRDKEKGWKKRLDETMVTTPSSSLLLFIHEPRPGQFRVLPLDRP